MVMSKQDISLYSLLQEQNVKRNVLESKERISNQGRINYPPRQNVNHLISPKAKLSSKKNKTAISYSGKFVIIELNWQRERICPSV